MQHTGYEQANAASSGAEDWPRRSGDVGGATAQRSATLEWFGPEEAADVEVWRAVRARLDRYHKTADALWRELKGALGDAVGARNARVGSTAPIEWAETLTGAFTVTRFQHPMALLDVLTDIESGMVACVYTLTAADTGASREHLHVLLMRGTESELHFTSQDGRLFSSIHESAQEALRPYLNHLEQTAASQRGSSDVRAVRAEMPENGA